MTTAFLGIYLNDHLAGATAGVELARRTAAAQHAKPAGAALASIAAEIAEDRDALVEIMRALDVPVRQYKVYAGWAAEKVGRLKFNGQLTSRSPLSDFIELEGLRLGVEGKLALWRILVGVTAAEPRLDRARLDDLVARAERQISTLEDLRMAVGAQVLAAG
jgi:hypothetical protein